MPTSSKRPSKLAAPPRVKPLVKASSPSAQPFLRFYHSKSLRAKTLAVLTTLEKAKDSTQHRDAWFSPVYQVVNNSANHSSERERGKQQKLARVKPRYSGWSYLGRNEM
jgi:hypothetical protein